MAKILIVEDNEMYRDMLARRLTHDGYSVVACEDGAEGVELASREQPDIILMDMGLPVMDGLEATKSIKSDDKTAVIPIIILTAQITAKDRENAFSAGCNDFATKPIEIRRLLSKIEKLLNSA